MIRALQFIATRWYARRWLFGLGAGLCLVIVFITTAKLAANDTRPAIAAFLAAITALFALSWGCFLACTWFHPIQGSLYLKAPYMDQARPRKLTPQRAARFLLLWLIIGVLVMPALMLSQMQRV
jgi:hypothetical protein